MMQPLTAMSLFLAIIPFFCFCQRPFYAGHQPYGFSDTPAENNVDSHVKEDLPPQLNGDLSYADRLDKLPEDQQPMWYLNWKHYKNLLENPQTHPQKIRGFNDNRR